MEHCAIILCLKLIETKIALCILFALLLQLCNEYFYYCQNRPVVKTLNKTSFPSFSVMLNTNSGDIQTLMNGAHAFH